MTFPFLLIEVDQQSICWMRVFSLQRIPLSQKGGFLRVFIDSKPHPKSSTNSEAGDTLLTSSLSRARVHATYSRWRSVS